MKYLAFLLLFPLIACDLSELEDEEGNVQKRGFEFIEAEQNLTPTEKVNLNELCEALGNKPTRSFFNKKVTLIKRSCDGATVTEDLTLQYNGNEFVRIANNGRTVSYESPFSSMLTSEEPNIKSLCDRRSEAQLSRYINRNVNSATQVKLSEDVANCYYNNFKRGSGPDGVCVQIVTAMKSNPNSNVYDQVITQSNYVVFKSSFNVPRIGMPKYQMFIDGVCTQGSSAQLVYEEVYLGP